MADENQVRRALPLDGLLLVRDLDERVKQLESRVRELSAALTAERASNERYRVVAVPNATVADTGDMYIETMARIFE